MPSQRTFPVIASLDRQSRIFSIQTALEPGLLAHRPQQFLTGRHAHLPHPPPLPPTAGSNSGEATPYDSGTFLARQCVKVPRRYTPKYCNRDESQELSGRMRPTLRCSIAPAVPKTRSQNKVVMPKLHRSEW
jgi:hypothetical protein